MNRLKLVLQREIYSSKSSIFYKVGYVSVLILIATEAVDIEFIQELSSLLLCVTDQQVLELIQTFGIGVYDNDNVWPCSRLSSIVQYNNINRLARINTLI